jgi:hypothetical protein
LLAKKLLEKNPTLLEKQVQTTSLYFSNRLWLQHLLNGESNHHDAVAEELPEITALTAENPISMAIEPTEAVQEIKEDAIDEQHLTKEESEETVRVEEREQVAVVAPSPDMETIKEDFIDEQPLTKEESGETVHVEEREQVQDEHVSHETIQTEPMPEVLEVKPVQDSPTPPELPALKITPISPGAEVVFEPFHTVDYFASQGIKFKEDEKPKDRFSQQLKSFTEWLKTMKRIPASEITPVTDTATEKKVEQLAEYSLAERHVITEAMAEVWTKQGNKVKAEEIYRKLSLLDPSKSSYFAAKIEELKKPN